METEYILYRRAPIPSDRQRIKACAPFDTLEAAKAFANAYKRHNVECSHIERVTTERIEL